MADINTFIIAEITAIAAIVGAVTGPVTNYLIERQRNRNEEKRHQQEEEAKKLNLRDQAYMKFLSIRYEYVHPSDESDEPYFEPDRVNEISASVITYGSPKVSSLLARTFPFKSWEEIEDVKRQLASDMVLEKDDLKKKLGAKSWWQFWK